MSSRVSHVVPSRSECETKLFWRHHPAISHARSRWVMRFCRNVMLASRSHARTALNVSWSQIVSTIVSVYRAIMDDTVNLWLTRAMAIHVAIMEHARYSRREDSAANVQADSKVHDVKWILMIVELTSVSTTAHVSMASNRTHASVCPALLATIAKRKSNSVVMTRIHVKTKENVLIILHITHVSARPDTVVRIAPRTSTIASITFVRMAELVLMASMTTSVNVPTISLVNSVKAHHSLRWCTHKLRHVKITNVNSVFASNRIRRRLITSASARQAIQESSANI